MLGNLQGDSDSDMGGEMTEMNSAAKQLVADRIRVNTSKDYRNKMKTMAKLITRRAGSHAVNHLVTGNPNMPKVPMDPDITMSFFGELSERRPAVHPIFGKIHKKTQANNGHPSAQTVSGFKSAIVWWHLESHGVPGTGVECFTQSLRAGSSRATVSNYFFLSGSLETEAFTHRSSHLDF